jgi:hypothetical protein
MVSRSIDGCLKLAELNTQAGAEIETSSTEGAESREILPVGSLYVTGDQSSFMCILDLKTYMLKLISLDSAFDNSSTWNRFA